MMPFRLGIGCALAVGILGTRTGLDLERAYYPTALVVIAPHYVLIDVLAGAQAAGRHDALIMNS